MRFEQVQSVIGLGAEEAGVGALIRVQLQVILKRSVRQEALTALMAHVTAAVPPVVSHVLVQLVFISKGFPALRTFKGSKGLTDE